MKKTGEEGTNRFNNFFNKSASVVVNKYIGLINDYCLYEAFGDDERRRFWRQFEFIQYDKTLQRNNQIMIMEMGDTIVTEFLGQAMGPIYFFKKDVFEKDVKKYFRRYKGQELKSKLYQNHESENSWSYVRQVHTHNGSGFPSWIDYVTYLLLVRYKITKRRED